MILKVDYDDNDFLEYIEFLFYYFLENFLVKFQNKCKKLRALIIGKNGPRSSCIIKDNLSCFFSYSKNITFDIYDSYKLSYDEIINKNYDIIISSLDLDASIISYHYIPDQPLKKDLFELVDKIYNLMKESQT